jgi:hypothetical protein
MGDKIVYCGRVTLGDGVVITYEGDALRGKGKEDEGHVYVGDTSRVGRTWFYEYLLRATVIYDNNYMFMSFHFDLLY